jgi:(p)ppGpp synthase/HD superfamily hydrolase
MDRIQHATVFATQAHTGQKRKYTGDDYIVHPIAVAELVRERGGSENQIMAALLHDTIEDTSVEYMDVERSFGIGVAKLVLELTDYYTHERFPEKNRAERKKLEADRLARVSDEAKLVKLCDMIDNTSSITEHDPGFAKVYLVEKAHLYDVMGLEAIADGNPTRSN